MLNNVVFLGCTNNYGNSFSANNTKVEFIAKGLCLQKDKCYIHNGINGTAGTNEATYQEVENIGTIVNYPIKKNWYISPIYNYSLLVSDLKKWYRKDMMNWVIIEAPYLPYYYLSILAARKTGYKIAVISHEWLGTFRNSNIIKRSINHLYSKVFGYSVDAILPISNYIIERIAKFKRPYIKVPIEADFSDTVKITVKEPYFLYCVSADYIRVIGTVLDGFRKFHNQGYNYDLILVLSGSQEAINRVFEMISEMNMADNVIIKSRLPHNELMSLNKNASGLVVPLNPDFDQDKARFSQKIAEYLAAGTAIISNNVGEIQYYFKNRINIVLDDYTSDGFFRSFKWIADNKSEAIKIGIEGNQIGRRHFDYRVCGKQLHDFLQTITK